MDRLLIVCVALTCATATPGWSQAPPRGGATNQANNPLTPKITINFQDQWGASLYGVDGGSNVFLFRGVIPNQLLGKTQLFRFTLPVSTVPDVSGNTTGLGDLNLIDVFPFKRGHAEFGLGPQLTIPTATADETGTGKWQIGAAGIAVAPQHWGLIGGFLNWQTDFAGADDRPGQNTLSAQPLIIYNLPDGWYLRSSATLNFDLERGHNVIPIGAGAGKVFAKPNGNTINLFAEPQFTIAHSGAGQPQFQLFSGVNLQFRLR